MSSIPLRPHERNLPNVKNPRQWKKSLIDSSTTPTTQKKRTKIGQFFCRIDFATHLLTCGFKTLAQSSID
tara:strand:+ start:1003 stop:1212 length:210 start_codon:yes stop_codon:yes gene_type:complete